MRRFMRLTTQSRAAIAVVLLSVAVLLAPRHRETQASDQAPASQRVHHIAPATMQRIYSPLPAGSWVEGELKSGLRTDETPVPHHYASRIRFGTEPFRKFRWSRHSTESDS